MASDGEDTHASAGVRGFVLSVLDSFEKLELTITLAQQPSDSFEIDRLIDATGFAAAAVQESMQALVEAEVVAADDAKRWRIRVDGPWREAVSELAALYVHDRVEVLELMTRSALERLRGRTMRAFANAFVLGTRKKGGSDV